MADKKVSELTALTNVSGDDLLLVIDDPLGTPASKKVTISNLFANVVPNSTHKGIVNFNANTLFRGTTLVSTANVSVTGDLSVNGYSVVTELNAKQSASASASQLANTNLAIADRMQVANTVLIVNDRMQVGNTISSVSTDPQRIAGNFYAASTSNTSGVLLTEDRIIVNSSNNGSAFLRLYSAAVDTSNSIIAKHTSIVAGSQNDLANNAVLVLPTSNGTLALLTDVVQLEETLAQRVKSPLHIDSSNNISGVTVTEGHITIRNDQESASWIELFSSPITSNSEYQRSTKIETQVWADMANNVVVTLPASNGTIALTSDYLSLADLKTLVAASTDFDDFKTRIAAL
jgi:hypothetical protein